MHRIVTGGRARWLVLGAVAVMLLAACGDDDDDDRRPPAATDPGQRPGRPQRPAGPQHRRHRVPPGGDLDRDRRRPSSGGSPGPSRTRSRSSRRARRPRRRRPPRARPSSPPSTPPATTYDGKSLVNSGLLPLGPTAGPAVPSSRSPPRASTATSASSIPLMTGTITVAGEGAAVDTQADINERADTRAQPVAGGGPGGQEEAHRGRPQAGRERRRLHHLDLRDGRHHRAHRRPGLRPRRRARSGPATA